jgi:methylmalonyl-CoA mutase N-terminal domain/subunit
VQAALEAGLKIDDFASQLSFFFNAHNNFFEEVSKFRAARRMWARIMKERFGAKHEETMRLRFHVQTGGSTLTAQQIENNVVRVTMQALAAVLGGCQSLHTNSRDEALALPTEDSVRIALRTQQIIAHESGVTDSVDPLGGSFVVESMTDAIEERVWEYIRTIDDLGGAVRAIEQQYYQTQIAESAYKYQMAIESGEKIIVGVNECRVEEKGNPETLRVPEEIRSKQIMTLAQTKAMRDQPAVEATLKALRERAQTKENLIPVILAAVEAYASIGEISDVLRGVWGEHEK